MAVARARMLDERERLDGLAEAHVIRQACAQSPPPQELQPRIAATLVRAQGGAQGRWLWQFFEGLSALELVQQIGHPTRRRDAADLDARRWTCDTQRHADHFASGGAL